MCVMAWFPNPMKVRAEVGEPTLLKVLASSFHFCAIVHFGRFGCIYVCVFLRLRLRLYAIILCMKNHNAKSVFW